MIAPQVVVLLCLILAFIAEHGSQAQNTNVLIRLRNSCSFSVWAAWTTDPGVPNPVSSGTQVSPGGTASLFIANDWSGRFWGRTNCSWRPPPGSSTSRFICDTGDCGSGDISCSNHGTPPATFAHLNLPDRYSVSLLEGYNLPVSISPRNSSCHSAGCTAGSDLNSVCPKELALMDKSGGKVIGCKSPCLAIGGEYCCRGKHSCSRGCKADKYAKVFKSACPKATTSPCNAVEYSCKSPAEIDVTFCA